MKVSRRAEYESTQFKMADLRQIVRENESIPDECDVDLRVDKPYPGEYGSTRYFIEIGE